MLSTESAFRGQSRRTAVTTSCGAERSKFEGGWNPARLVIIEFPSLEQAKRWYDSDEYRPLKELRSGAGDVEGILVQGLDPD